MNLKKILCLVALVISGLLGLLFTLDLAIGIPFGRSDITTDILVALAAGLLIWQGVETWFEK
jgi:zinc transporter ZupT